MGTDPFTKSWWFLEAHDGSWLADRDHELFTREPHKALKWPNFTDADRARRALHQPLWNRIRAPTEHVFLDLETPTPPPVPAVTREELVGIIRPWVEAALTIAARVLDEGAVEGVARVIDEIVDARTSYNEEAYIRNTDEVSRAVLAYLKGESNGL